MLITKSYNKRENYAGQRAREVDLTCEVCNETRISFTVYEVDGWRNKITSQLRCQHCKSKNGIPVNFQKKWKPYQRDGIEYDLSKTILKTDRSEYFPAIKNWLHGRTHSSS